MIMDDDTAVVWAAANVLREHGVDGTTYDKLIAANDDPVDVHGALQKAARELLYYADHGYSSEYFHAIDRLRRCIDGLSSHER
jgi:hypothetical protein